MTPVPCPFVYRAIVVEVHDGDTVTLDVDLGFLIAFRLKIRMLGINAPELRELPAGPDARDYLRGLLPVGAAVTLASQKDRPDKYGGRYLGTLWVNGVNVNQDMLDTHHAEPYNP